IIDDPFMYSGVRQYSPGDSLNNINWKATARTGSLQVHKRDYTSDPRLMVYLNMDVTENMWGPITEPDLIEEGISYAASIIQYGISQGINTGFGCNGHLIGQPPRQSVRILPRNGEGHLTFLFEAMARLVVERSVTFHTFLEGDIEDKAMGAFSGSVDYLFITAFVNERMENQIRQLENMGNSVEILWLKDPKKDGEKLGA
ncbi:MAG TPA: DUF58 domain-containing protein, partial [Clostridia bacterium]|nr:DUF58 domain-containing protein [Clostridia bacterium]